MSKDPYQVLGVAKSASQEEIRKAYRKLAKELHPDLNPGDKAAEDRFKEVSAAYGILGDEEQRGRFDRGEIDASGAERQEHPFYREYAGTADGGRYQSSAGFEDMGDFSDLFSDLFGGRARGRGGFGPGGPGGPGGGPGAGGFKMRGADMRYHLEVSFLEAVNGAQKRITLPGGGTLDLSIPAGTEDGAVLRLKGKGAQGMNGGPAGDALVTIAVKAHPFFERDGNDLLIDLPITLDEAVLGAKVEVPTATGRVTLTVPKGASSGTVLRLKGKGAAPKGKTPGDQLVTLQVKLPETIDPDLETFMQTWRETHAYDPRAALKRA